MNRPILKLKPGTRRKAPRATPRPAVPPPAPVKLAASSANPGDTPPTGTRAEVAAFLSQSPTWRNSQAMAVGFYKQAVEPLPDTISRRQLRLAVCRRAYSRGYLARLAHGGQRTNFDGTPADPITPDQRSDAAMRLSELKTNQPKRKDQ